MTSLRPAHEGQTDEDLLAAYVGGADPEGTFTELVTRYERRVYGICYRYFGTRVDAEEATQDVFVNIARRAGSFTGDSKLSTWIYRVTVNACHDHARKRARRPETPTEDMTSLVEAGTEPGQLGWGPGDPVTGDETADAIQLALLQLDELSRSLLLLVAIEGLSYAEAATALDVPIGTAKSRVHRARAQLADLLAPERNSRAPSGVRLDDDTTVEQ